MSNANTTFVVDFDDTEVDDKCGMKLWWKTFESGCGIQNKENVIAEAIEAETPKDFRAISEAEDLAPHHIQAMIDSILEPLTDEDRKDTRKMELLYRRLGWLAAFALYTEPHTRVNYDKINIEPEIALDRGSMWVITKPGALLKSKVTGDLVYREYIPMPPQINNKLWLESHHYNMRIHVGMAAAEQIQKTKIHFGQLMGVSLGYTSSVDGHLVHPYVYGWFNSKTNEWSHAFKTSTDGDWKKVPVWDFPGGVVAWVRLCGEQTANYQLAVGPSVKMQQGMIDSWVNRQINRQRKIAAVKSTCHSNITLRAINFPQQTSQCRPPQGEACGFLRACWNPQINNMPLKSGEFILNTNFSVGKKVA